MVRHCVVICLIVGSLNLCSSLRAASGSEMLRIYPSYVTVTSGRRVRFTAVTMVGDRDAYTAPSLAWSATGGSIDDDGVFRAGVEPGEHRVEVSYRGHQATAVVQVRADEVASEQLPSRSHMTVRHWRHGRIRGQSAEAHVVVRSFGPRLAEVRLVAVGLDGQQEIVARQSTRDRSRRVLRGVYDPGMARWLELRLVDDRGQVVDRVRRPV